MSKNDIMRRFSFIVYKDDCNNGEYEESLFLSGKFDNSEDTEFMLETDNYAYIITVWEDNLDEFEGMNYLIFDRKKDTVVIGGVYDPTDYDILEDYTP